VNGDFPPPKPKAAEPASTSAQPIKPQPATVKLPEKPAKVEPAPDQKKLALKAAMRAIKANGGKGFRIRSKKTRARKARSHRQQGRAPP